VKEDAAAVESAGVLVVVGVVVLVVDGRGRLTHRKKSNTTDLIVDAFALRSIRRNIYFMSI